MTKGRTVLKNFKKIRPVGALFSCFGPKKAHVALLEVRGRALSKLLKMEKSPMFRAFFV